MRLGLRRLSIMFAALSGLWLAATIVPVLYAICFPAADFQQIVRALRLQTAPPPLAIVSVQTTIESAGPLLRAVQVGYFSKLTITVQLNSERKSRRTQQSYLASFARIRKPVLLIIEREEQDGVVRRYEIGEGEPFSLVRSLGIPIVVFACALYMLNRKPQTP